VYALGVKLQGRATSGSANGSYVLEIKNFDFEGGLGQSPGEAVSSTDFNSLAAHLNENDSQDPKNWWRDFDSSGAVTTVDYNMLNAHMNHNCTSPNNP
jgi:hypothetical protein